MKNLIILLIATVLLSGCIKKNSTSDVIATKCRLNIPVQKELCESVNVYRTKGGQLKGLPVSEHETGLDAFQLIGHTNTTNN